MCTDDEPKNHARGQPITQDKFYSLYQLVQYVKIGSEVDQPTEDVTVVNCFGTLNYDLSSKSYTKVCLNYISLILDWDASEHMTSDLRILFNVKMLPKPIYVTLLNSNKALFFQLGEVTILPNFTVNHVLFFPCFTYNILSIYNLCFQFNFILIFSGLGATFADLFNEKASGSW